LYEGNKGLSALFVYIDELHANAGIFITGIERIYMDDFSADMDRFSQTGNMKEKVNDIMCLVRTSGLDEHAAPTDVLREFVGKVVVSCRGYLKGDRTALGSPLLRSREYDGLKHIKGYQRAA